MTVRRGQPSLAASRKTKLGCIIGQARPTALARSTRRKEPSQHRRIHAGFEKVIQYCRLQRTLGCFHCLSADRQAWPRFRAPTLSGIGVSLPLTIPGWTARRAPKWFHLNTAEMSRPDRPGTKKPRSRGAEAIGGSQRSSAGRTVHGARFDVKVVL